jgi:hypothetical protein
MKTKKLKKLSYEEVVLLSAEMRIVAAKLARDLKAVTE